MSRIDMKKRDQKRRVKDFEEVNEGYSLNEAVAEASRCLQCENPSCVEGCPLGIDVPGFIKGIMSRDVASAIDTIKERNALPGICGRICPHERLCEGRCRLNEEGKSVAIGNLERFAADNEDNIFIIPDNIRSKRTKDPMNKSGLKVAIIGSGPAGLACSAELAGKGYEIDVYEAMDSPGGVLNYGIPEFRLPKAVVDKEIGRIVKRGVRMHYNHVIGRTISVDDLQNGYDAVFLATGAGHPVLPEIPGSHLIGVQSSHEYLARVNMMGGHDPLGKDTPLNIHEKVIIVGGGNSALDCARVARRLGSDATIVFDKSHDDLISRKDDFESAKEEGVGFYFMTEPLRVIGDSRVEGVQLAQSMPETGVDGRKRYVQISGTEFIMGCNQLIFAKGHLPSPLVPNSTQIQHRMDRSVIVDRKYRTSKRRVFAGGGITDSSILVAEAIRDGMEAARAIDEMLSGEE